MKVRYKHLVSVLGAFAGFSFLLHFAWEMLQSSLYSGMRQLGHAEGVWICTRATLGDLAIALIAYTGGALSQRDACWVLRPRAVAGLAFLLTGLVITLATEHLATIHLLRWAYSELMPTVPVLGMGLSPLLQWLLVPLLAAWLTARHVLGAR